MDIQDDIMNDEFLPVHSLIFEKNGVVCGAMWY